MNRATLRAITAGTRSVLSGQDAAVQREQARVRQHEAPDRCEGIVYYIYKPYMYNYKVLLIVSARP